MCPNNFSSLLYDQLINEMYISVYTYTYSKDENYVCEMHLAGYSKEDLIIETNSITGVFVRSKKEEITSDREFDTRSKVNIEFNFPKDSDMLKIKCKINNGILKITVPKKEEFKNRLITVE